MKRFILMFVICLNSIFVKAQLVWDIDSTITPDYILMDSILQNVNLSRMHTNILLYKGYTAQNPLLYNGVLTDSTDMNKFNFQALYYTMLSSQVDTNIFNPYDSLESWMEPLVSNHSTSISIMAMDYHRIKASSEETA